ncbi:hypothetical protein [Phycicoccus duodecadis]|uniref:Uncharacterized protein n=1 Tax=Phycicoccus duodecadis TaxID=173053 RepID=A0A2N3YKK4_9MICO|nr:hypothetical protein [Phycicoccus duodecadis]PKW27372.1 hypothetical protein ATL31_2213 [Phycicoccus duodecadis]
MSTDDTRPLSDRLGLADEEPAHTSPGAAHSPGVVDAAAATPAPGAPVHRRGPAPFGLVIAVLGLVVAGAVLLTEVADVSVPWSTLGPWAVVAGGLLVVLVGLIGLRGNRVQD